MQQARLAQFLHHHRHSARFVKVFGDILATGLHIHEVGGVAKDFAHVIEEEIDPRFMRHGRKVQARVGRPACAGHDPGGVLEGLPGADVARADVFLDQVHDRRAGGFGIGVARFIGGGRARGVGQREADRLGHAGHGVGSELPAAGPGRWAGDALQHLERGFGHRAVLEPAHRLEHVLNREVAAGEIFRHIGTRRRLARQD